MSSNPTKHIAAGEERDDRYRKIEAEFRRTSEDLRFRLAFEDLIARISTRFIAVGPDRLDLEIVTALGEIGGFSGVDRSYVFVLDAAGATFDNTHEWCALGVEPQIDNLQGVPADMCPWWMERLTRLENVYVPRVDRLPPEAEAERQLLESQSIQSLVSVPLVEGRTFVGFVGFDWVRSAQLWTDDHIKLLRMFGDIIGGALQRRRMLDTLATTERQLLQAQKLEAVGRLAGGVAHDFNNVLTAILGFSDLALHDADRGVFPRRELEEIRRAADRAASLTRQLLAFSRRQVLNTRILDLNSAVREMEGLLRRLLGEDIDLKLILGPDAGSVSADPGQLEQVVMNLAVNARDAMPSGGSLVIRTSTRRLTTAAVKKIGDLPPGDYARLSVSDSGQGMDPGTIARIFEPFFTTKEAGKGTGLGLATVYGIVKQSRGWIEVESDPGKGATFIVSLPRAEGRPSVEPKAGRAPAVTAGTGTVLVVEDDPAVASLVRESLERGGYRVLSAASGAEALVRANEEKGEIDLLVTDLVMPLMGGAELINRLSALRPALRVLIMTGYGDSPDFPRHLVEAGAGLLLKPFGPAALLRMARGILDAEPGAAMSASPGSS